MSPLEALLKHHSIRTVTSSCHDVSNIMQEQHTSNEAHLCVFFLTTTLLTRNREANIMDRNNPILSLTQVRSCVDLAVAVLSNTVTACLMCFCQAASF